MKTYVLILFLAFSAEAATAKLPKKGGFKAAAAKAHKLKKAKKRRARTPTTRQLYGENGRFRGTVAFAAPSGLVRH